MRLMICLGLAVAACSLAQPAGAQSAYPVHTNITATVFWVGEPQGGGSSEDNALSAWDDAWLAHYGGYDDYSYVRSSPYFPAAFAPRENPFYLDLPYNDFNDNGNPRRDRATVVPWAAQYAAQIAKGQPTFSLMKNRWVKVWRTVAGVTYTAYGQIEDAGPYVYNDSGYVFGSTDQRPKSRTARNAGMDVSPALRDALRFSGLNDDSNKVSWQFVEASEVPAGPWTQVVTTRQVYWP